VVAERENNPPAILSKPSHVLVMNTTWTYQIIATDPDADTLIYSLVDPPKGMTINEETGLVTWKPTNGQIGQHTLKVRVFDIYGKGIGQDVILTVQSTNSPPVMEGIDFPTLYLNETVNYQVEASDPAGLSLRYELVAPPGKTLPAGLTINENTGLITWSPTVTGVFELQVNVYNSAGLGIGQMFGVLVEATRPNTAPVITSTPVMSADEGKIWTYQLTGSDFENSPLSFSVSANYPLPDGMIFDSETGLVTWTPSSANVGQTYTLQFEVSDGDKSSSQRFTLTVYAKNNPPTVTNISPQTAMAGAAMRVDVRANDLDKQDRLTYSLDTDSQQRGMTIDAYGRMTWTPAQNQVGETYSVTIYVTDGRDEPVSTTFTVTVTADTAAPTIVIGFTPPKANMNGTVIAVVSATDNVGVAKTSLLLKSVRKPSGEIIELNETFRLDATGRVSIPLNEKYIGVLLFEATAIDAAGNIGTKTSEYLVTDPRDINAATVSILPVSSDGKVYGPVDIRGTIKDDSDGVMWTVTIIPYDSGESKIIATGTGNIENGTICQFDPTMLRNGDYDIVVNAVDTGGNETVKSQKVTVEGAYKLGNFTMTFTDFDLQLSGLPIQITRTYDTLNADVKGDFGYGWTLDIVQYKMLVDYGDGQLSEPNPYREFQNGDKLYFVLPDGSKEGFVFTPQGGGSSGGGLGGWLGGGMTGGSYMYAPQFTPMYGNKSELLYDSSRYITPSGYGLGYEDFYGTGETYTPFNGFYGGVSIKLRNGTVLDFDTNSGELVSATEKSGHSLKFYDNKIVHSSGKQILIERNYQGFISAMMGPDGQRITFDYDSNGNLISVTDPAGAKTEFTYLDDPKAPEHYLDTIIDSLGRPAAKTEYDTEGRIKKITDADGKTIEYEFDTDSKIQKVTDQLGNTTIIQNDDRGNVIREVSPTGNETLRSYDFDGRTLSETTVVMHNGKEIHLTTSYTYDAYGNKLTETDSRGNVTRYTYDQYGQVVSTTTGGVTTQTNYDSYTGLPTSTTDVNGNITSYKYVNGNMTSLFNSGGVQLIDSTYNKYGEVTSIKSTNDRTTHLKYDANGDCTETYYEENGYRILDKTIYDEARRVIGREHWIIPVITGLQPLGVTTPESVTEPVWSTKTEYNAAGQVVREIDQNGLETRYKYDFRGLQTEVRTQSKDSDGQVVWYIQRTVYDAAGRTIAGTERYAEGISASQIGGQRSTYDGDGRNIGSEQVIGLLIELDANNNSYVKSVGTILASSSTVYNTAGWVISSLDTNNLETRYVYNVYGEVTQTRRELPNNGGWIVSETVYDSQGRVIFSTDSHLEGSDEPVYGTETKYDAQGRSIGSVRYKGSIVTIDDDGNTQVVSKGTQIYGTSTEYDSKGRTKSSTDAYGNITTYEYDNLDRQVAVNQQTIGLRSETVYNKQGQVEKTISNIKIKSDGTYDYFDSITTTNEYNLFGQVVKTVTDGRIVEYEYDDLGRQIATIDHPTTINGEVVRHRSETVYDEYGRVSISRTNVKQFSDGTIDRSQAQELKYVYDAYGNVTKTIFADGTEISAVYNEQGQKISETNQLGQTRRFEYDIKSRLVAVILPAVLNPKTGQSVSPRYEYFYDDFGRQILIRDPNGGETRFEYDAFGNQISRTLPLGFGADGILGTVDDDILPEGDFTERSVYDDSGRLVKQISFEGIVTTFTYDDQGRVKSKTFFENQAKYFTNTPKETWTYTYDSQGRVTSIDQNGRKTETTYDVQGRTLSITTPEGTVYYEYDKFGRQIRVSSDKGNDTRYSYDIFGRLETVTDAIAGSVTTYEYDLVGNLARTTTQTSEARLVATYEYDNMNRLTKLTNFVDRNNNGIVDSGELVSKFGYTLDSQGRKIHANETFNVAGVEKTNKIDWVYDNAGRLIQEVFDHYDDTLDQTLGFEYDLVGNRLQQTLDRGNNGSIEERTTYTYDVNDRLLEEILDDLTAANKDRATIYGYDHTQQTSKVVSENGIKQNETTFEYDAQGRMSVVTITTFAEDGTKTRIERTSYGYGADGIRVSALHEIDADADGEFETSKLTEYLNDPLNITGYSQVIKQTETDLQTGEQANIIYIIGHSKISQIVVKNGTEQEYYFTFDGHGSTRALTDFAGAILELYAFDAYGNAIGFNPATALTEFLYSGEQFDSKIGQQYLRARYYDPATGRFNRLDPFFGNLSDPLSLHNYIYCHDNPVNGIDPTGEFFLPILALAVGFGVGLGIAYGIDSANAADNINSNFDYFTHVMGYALGGGAVAGGTVLLGGTLVSAPMLVLGAGVIGYSVGALFFDALYMYNHCSSQANEDVLGLILLSRWAVSTCPIFALTNWIQWGLGVTSFDCDKIKHMSNTIYSYKNIKTAMYGENGTGGLYAELKANNYKGYVTDSPEVKLNLDDSPSNWLTWILGDVNIKGEIIDNNGGVKWTVFDTVDAKTYEDAVKKKNLALGHPAGVQMLAWLEIFGSWYGDQTMKSSLKFEVTKYERIQ
jgi:RHS repeat-associated protein